MRRATLLAVLLCLLAAGGSALAAALTESYSTLVHQIDAGQVAIAYVNEETHHVQANLKDGAQQLVAFPSSQHKVLIDAMLHHGVQVIYTRKKPHLKPAFKPVHHVLRYIAGGVVAVLLLIGLGVWRYTRGPRTPPKAAANSE